MLNSPTLLHLDIPGDLNKHRMLCPMIFGDSSVVFWAQPIPKTQKPRLTRTASSVPSFRATSAAAWSSMATIVPRCDESTGNDESERMVRLSIVVFEQLLTYTHCGFDNVVASGTE